MICCTIINWFYRNWRQMSEYSRKRFHLRFIFVDKKIERLVEIRLMHGEREFEYPRVIKSFLLSSWWRKRKNENSLLEEKVSQSSSIRLTQMLFSHLINFWFRSIMLMIFFSLFHYRRFSYFNFCFKVLVLDFYLLLE